MWLYREMLKDTNLRGCTEKCQSSKLRLDLGNLPRNSSNEDRLQVSKEKIRIWKYFGEKLLPPH